MKQLTLLPILILLLLCCNSPKEKSNQQQTKTAIIDSSKTQKQEVVNNSITKALVLGKYNYKTDTLFTKVDLKYSTKQVYLNKEVYKAFLKLYNAAKTDGIEIKILSATRNFNEQKAIWERKWKKYNNLKPLERAKKILEYSSMPTTSRHHWGTDIDLNSLSNSYFSSGNGKKEYDWLVANANDFGFYQVYTKKDSGRTGYNLEKWHWSYLPLASVYLKYYNANITYKDINGFKGDTLAKPIKMIDNYVNGIAIKAKDYK